MNVCTQCHNSNPREARFCQSCGFALGQETVSGRTMVLNPTAVQAPALPGLDTRAVIERTRNAFGTQAAAASPTAIQHPGCGHQREDLFVVEDVSGSMEGEFEPDITKIQAAIRAAIVLVLHKYMIDPNDRIGVVRFDHQAQLLIELSPLSTHKPQIIQTLQSLNGGGGTDINEGLLEADNQHDWTATDVVRRIVLLTDGHGGHPLRTAKNLKAKGVVIDVIGIGPTPSAVDEKLLKKVASNIDGELHYRFIKDHHALVQHYTQLANKTKTTA